MSQGADQSPPSLAANIGEVGAVAGYLALLVFVTGWSYAEAYFGGMGLNLSAIDGIGAETYSAFALKVLGGGWGLVMVGMAVALPVVVCALWPWALLRLSPLWARCGAAALLSLALVGGVFGAQALAQERAEAVVAEAFAPDQPSPFHRVAVTATIGSGLEAYFQSSAGLGASTCLRKVFMDRKTLYAYPGYESLRDQPPEILMLPLAEISVIRVLAPRAFCTSDGAAPAP